MRNDETSGMGVESFRHPAESADEAILSAVAQRWQLLAQDASTAAAGFAFHPAREAAQLRQMVRAQGGAAPADTLTRVWRALAGDMLVARGLKTVYVAGGDMAQALPAARGYFGFGVNMVPLGDAREALEKADDSRNVLACVPWPEQAGAGQWWPILNENRFRDLSILAGWPSLPSATEGLRIAIVGKHDIEPSGEDDTFATAHDDQRAAERILRDLGLTAEVSIRARSLALIRISEFVAPHDARLETARRMGLDGLRVIGVRPRP